MSPLHVASTVILVVLAIGLGSRSDRRLHRTLMLVAFAADLAMVLYIEATRGAVEKVAAGPSPLLWFHVVVSVGVLACYVGMISLGTRLFAGRRELRHWHRYLGVTFVVLRGLNYVTSFII